MASPRKLPEGRVWSASEVAALSNRAGRGAASKSGFTDLLALHDEVQLHGYRQGIRRALLKIRSALDDARRFQSGREAWMNEFIFTILKKVLGDSGATTLMPLIVQHVVDECDRKLGTISIRVSTDVVGDVKRHVAGLDTGELHIDVVADESLAATDCEVQTPFGIVDFGLDTQLDVLNGLLCGAEPQHD